MKLQRRALISILAGFLATGLKGQVENEVVTFADHISPIIRKNCVDCHHPGGIGPFDLSSSAGKTQEAAKVEYFSLLSKCIDSILLFEKDEFNRFWEEPLETIVKEHSDLSYFCIQV